MFFPAAPKPDFSRRLNHAALRAPVPGSVIAAVPAPHGPVPVLIFPLFPSLFRWRAYCQQSYDYKRQSALSCEFWHPQKHLELRCHVPKSLSSCLPAKGTSKANLPVSAALHRTAFGGLIALAATLLAPVAQAQSAPSAFTSATRYDDERQVTGTIAPDPDGTGPLHYAAVRNSYDAAGRVIRVEKGELLNWQSESVAPANWTNFTIFSYKAKTKEE